MYCGGVEARARSCSRSRGIPDELTQSVGFIDLIWLGVFPSFPSDVHS